MMELLGGDQPWLDGLSGTELPEIQPETHELIEATLPPAEGNVEPVALADDAAASINDKTSAGSQESLPEEDLMAGQEHTTPHLSQGDSNIISFEGNAWEGGQDHTNMWRIAGDQAENPHCGFHALANFPQSQNPVMGEEITRTIYRIAENHGWLSPHKSGGFTLQVSAYKPILEQAFNIPCDWFQVQPESLLPALEQGHMTLAIGKAEFLDPARYSSTGETHAFNITGYKVVDGQLFMRGLDSNVPKHEMLWPVENVRKAMMAAGCGVLVSRHPLGPVI